MGLAQKLMLHFEQSLDHSYGVFLFTTADNFGALRFYEKMHYQRIGVLPSYVLPGIDEVIYFKPKDQLTLDIK